MADYRLVAQQREKDGLKQPKSDPNKNNRIVIEPAPVEPKRPPQKNWPPKVSDENSYDRNVIDPYDKNYSKRVGAPEPIKKA